MMDPPANDPAPWMIRLDGGALRLVPKKDFTLFQGVMQSWEPSPPGPPTVQGGRSKTLRAIHCNGGMVAAGGGSWYVLRLGFGALCRSKSDQVASGIERQAVESR